MVKKIKLTAQDSALRLEFNENNWCICFLECENQELRLGANTDSIIIKRLLSGLKDEKKEVHHRIGGVDVFCIFTLFENHYTLYAAEQKEGSLALYWQDPNANVTCTTALSSHERRKWISQLQEESNILQDPTHRN